MVNATLAMAPTVTVTGREFAKAILDLWSVELGYTEGVVPTGAEARERTAALDTVDAESEAAAAHRLVDRKLRSTRGLDPATRARRLAGMLARKGYPSGLAYRVVREALAADQAWSDDAGPALLEGLDD
jgi:hypothetical protein